MATNNHNPEVSPKSNNSILIDRGCDIETGRYWARVGAEYQTFWSSMIRDQWVNHQVCMASKLSNDDPRLLAESAARTERMETRLYGAPRPIVNAKTQEAK